MSKRIRIKTTAYGPPWDSMEGGGITSTGVKLRAGQQKLVVAVDPTVIPYGTKLKIPGNPFGDDNLIFTAADTGGAFQGGTNKVDFFVAGKGNETNHDRLNNWGVKDLTAIIVGKGSPRDVALLGSGSAMTVNKAKQKSNAQAIGKLTKSTVETQQFDRAAYDQAVRKSAVASMLTKSNPKSLLLTTGALSTTPPDPSQFTSTVAKEVMKYKAPAATAAAASVKATAPRPSGTKYGHLEIAPGASNGKHTQEPWRKFVREVAGAWGKPMVATTTTNHNQYTTSGNVSEHYEGNAGDFGIGEDIRGGGNAVGARKGDEMAAHAIAIAGRMSYSAAMKLAKAGGIHNFNTPLGRVQIIWRVDGAQNGGNHFNHVHIGVNPSR